MIGLDALKHNIQIFFLLILWVIAGLYTGPGVFLFIPITLILIFANDKFPEILIGFIFILILSDSLEAPMAFAKSFKNIYILLLFFFLIISLKSQIAVSTTYKYFLPYFIFALIGLLYSPVFFTSFQKLLSYVLLFITVPNYVLRSYQISGIDFFRNLIYFLLTIIVIGVLLRFYNPAITFSHGGRLRGIFGNPNGLGIYMILFFILFTITRIKFPKLFSRAESVLIYLIMFYVLYKTGSRTALLAVILFFVFNQVFKYSMFFGFILFFATLVSIEFLILYFPRLIIFLGMSESLRVETLDQGSGRVLAWQFAWENIQDSFFIGRGVGFDEDLMRKNSFLLSKAGHQGGVHNTYLIIWLNTGLLGLISFLRGFFKVFLIGSKYNSFAFPAMFAVMISINFEPWLAASLNPFTILFLIIVTLITEDIFNKDLEKETETEDDEEVESIPQVG
jgi:O-antigen ligase